jgi:hypothetical protein
MSFLKRLFGGSDQPTDDGAIHLYVKCNNCGAPVHVRISPQNDLSGDEEEGYFVSKEIMDDRCFRLMRAELHFDSRRRETSREIERGTFVTHDEYESLLAERNAGRSSAA